MMLHRWLANAALLLVTLVWGATFTLTKGALQAVSVFPYLSIRFTIATILLVVLSVMSPRTRKSFQIRTVLLGCSLGILLFGAYALQTFGLQYTSASAAGFLTGLSVILVPLLGLPLFRIIPHPRSWYGTAIAVMGLGMLCGRDLFHFAVGDLLVLCCAVFLALQILVIAKYGREEDSLALATVEIGVLTICCLIWNGLHANNFPDLRVWLHPNVTWAILICAIPGTALAYWAQNAFQKLTTAAQTALIFSMEPVFAAIVARLTIQEALSATAGIGCLLIFMGMLIADPSLKFKHTGNLR
jgi:drug/metabolite transporter (DMT)-like permease